MAMAGSMEHYIEHYGGWHRKSCDMPAKTFVVAQSRSVSNRRLANEIRHFVMYIEGITNRY